MKGIRSFCHSFPFLPRRRAPCACTIGPFPLRATSAIKSTMRGRNAVPSGRTPSLFAFLRQRALHSTTALVAKLADAFPVALRRHASTCATLDDTYLAYAAPSAAALPFPFAAPSLPSLIGRLLAAPCVNTHSVRAHTDGPKVSLSAQSTARSLSSVRYVSSLSTYSTTSMGFPFAHFEISVIARSLTPSPCRSPGELIMDSVKSEATRLYCLVASGSMVDTGVLTIRSPKMVLTTELFPTPFFPTMSAVSSVLFCACSLLSVPTSAVCVATGMDFRDVHGRTSAGWTSPSSSSSSKSSSKSSSSSSSSSSSISSSSSSASISSSSSSKSSSSSACCCCCCASAFEGSSAAGAGGAMVVMCR
mmetsp:Transcript_10651/g.27023  ORF Transcript_10651/g.27023 Transcript_10651/m.27023 type:complete len:362 (+) Transcript_10651:667-1752(+)